MMAAITMCSAKPTSGESLRTIAATVGSVPSAAIAAPKTRPPADAREAPRPTTLPRAKSVLRVIAALLRDATRAARPVAGGLGW